MSELSERKKKKIEKLILFLSMSKVSLQELKFVLFFFFSLSICRESLNIQILFFLYCKASVYIIQGKIYTFYKSKQ